MKKTIVSLAFLILSVGLSMAAVTVGSGSYLTSFPGYDKAGRNGYPEGAPMLSGRAASRPVPTNDWWSNELVSPHGAGIFNYPMAIKPLDTGVALIKNVPNQAITAENPFEISVDGISCARTTVCDYSDWTVTIRWENSANSLEAIVGQGMPMVYLSKGGNAGKVNITVTSGVVSVMDNILFVSGGYNGASYAVYAPKGAVWELSGRTASSNLAGKSYFTAAMLPETAANPQSLAKDWERYAFVVPTDTKAEWNYDFKRSKVITKYSVETKVLEGSAATPLMGLLPHHWGYLSSSSVPSFQGTFNTVRGLLKVAPIGEFVTELDFTGALPVLPSAHIPATGYSKAELEKLVAAVCADNGFSDWTDSYNDGQLLNRLCQTALVARQAGDEAGARKAIDLVKTQLERWFTAKDGNIDFVFYYHSPWSTMLAYPAGHGQDTNLNDHNFHFGYFIGAAAVVSSFYPEWKDKWGGMVDLLVRDVASTDRDDPMFPYLRSFSPFSGHCWANGFATLGPGNDQESSSESMMCHAALLQWAEVTSNTKLRDAAVWMYATELSAIEEYWFDINRRNLAADYPSALASRVFANGYDDQNFWGGGIAGSYGIQVYPVQPSSTYLLHDFDYANRLWNSMSDRTAILQGSEDPNVWYDSWAQYLAMLDPGRGVEFYNKHKARMGKKFGSTEALTYYWVHDLAALGYPEPSITADTPMAQVFRNGEVKTYSAANWGPSSKTVTFSDGYKLNVAANSCGYESTGALKPAEKNEPWTDPGRIDPTPDPGSETGGCEFSGTDASEGSFKAPWYIQFTTLEDNSTVNVSVRFDNQDSYVGFAGPWLFNETDGFQELNMTSSGKWYTASLPGYKKGDKVKVRVKIAYAGGLGVTSPLVYTVGDNNKTGVKPCNYDIKVWPNPVDKELFVSECESYILYNAAGLTIKTGFEDRIYMADLVSGIYLLKVFSRSGGHAIHRIIKK